MGTPVAFIFAATLYLRSMFQDMVRRLRSALDPSEEAPLLEFSTFVRTGTSATSLSSAIHALPPPGNLAFSVTLTRRDISGEETRLAQTYVTARSASRVVQTLATCPTWTHAEFAFCQLGLDSLVEKVFALVRSSCSLSNLDVQLNCVYSRLLSELLCENSFLETVVLKRGAWENFKDAERIALRFVRNSVLKSCTVVVNSARLNPQVWEAALRPFVKGAGSLSLKELVVIETEEITREGSISGEALATLVRCNATLEKVEFRLSGLSLTVGRLFSEALAVNRTLREFRCNCKLAFWKEIASVFVPDASGCQANTHVTTLKLFPTVDCRVGDFMREISGMLESNSTLKHVEVALHAGIVWEVRAFKPPRCVDDVCTQDMLELMMDNELSVNAGLESLVVGSWKLLRVGGDQWQMSYGGPCLASGLFRLTAEYDVKVKMR